jgi:GH35 family endo-1,4-beta-xylanase
MHINTNATSYITRATVGCNIKRLGALGLEVHITEMDVRCRAGNGDTCDQRLKAYVVSKGLIASSKMAKHFWLIYIYPLSIKLCFLVSRQSSRCVNFLLFILKMN